MVDHAPPPRKGLLRSLFALQLKELLRNRLVIFFVLVFPLMFLFIFKSGSMAQTFKPIRAVIAQSGSSDAVTAFTDSMKTHEALVTSTDSPDASRSALALGTVDVVLVPEGAWAGEPGPSNLRILTKQRGQARQILLVLESVKARFLEAQGAEQASFNFVFESTAGSESRDFFSFVSPGLVVLALLQLGLFGTAVPLISARETDSLRYLLTTPIPPRLYVASHLAVRSLVVFVQVLVVVGCLGLVFGDRIQGSWTALIATAFAGGLMLVSLGYFLGASVPNQQIGALVLNVANFGGLFFGLVFTDIDHQSATRYMVYINPVAYVSDACRQVALGTAGAFPLWLDFLVIATLAVVFSSLAALAFRRNLLGPKP